MHLLCRNNTLDFLMIIKLNTTTMKKATTLLLLLALSCSAYAEYFLVDGLYYTLQADGTAKLVSENEVLNDGESSIPIGFSNGYRGDVVVPSSVEYNGEMHEVTAVSDYVFLGSTALTSITLPATVTQLGPTPFANSTKLNTITVDDDNPAYHSEDGVLYDKQMTTLLACPGARKGTMEVPASVTSIANSAFYGCGNLQKVSLPSTVTSIGVNAFRGCSVLQEVNIPDGIEEIQVAAFYGCRCVESFILPSTLTTIANQAFFYCQSLEDLVIPSSVTSIGDNAFEDCVSMSSVSIPSSLKSIGSRAFAHCTSLLSIEVPASVEMIGDGAFTNCTSLLNIDVASDNTCYCDVDGVLLTADTTLLLCCPGGKSGDYVVPRSVVTIGVSAFGQCRYLTSVTMPQTLDSLAYSAFNGCWALTEVEMPGNVRSIGENAFGNCTSLTSLTCHATTPPSAFTNSFMTAAYYLPLHVPSRSVAKYKKAAVWRYFKNILPIEENMVAKASEAYTGAMTYIDIDLKVAEDGVRAYTFDLELPEGVTPVMRDGTPLCTFSDRHDGTPTFVVQQIDENTSSWRITVTMGEGCRLLEYDGNVMRLYLRVAADVEPAAYSCVLDNPTITLSDGYQTSMENCEFDITVTGALMGDVNLDGTVSVSDVMGVVSYVLGFNTDVFVEPLGDVNGDNTISVADVTGIVSLVLDL